MNRIVQQRARLGCEIRAGGSYIGANRLAWIGSRPLYHHNANMTANVTSGRKTTGFPPMNHTNLVSTLGCLKIPLGIKTSMVIPSAMGSGLLVSN